MCTHSLRDDREAAQGGSAIIVPFVLPQKMWTIIWQIRKTQNVSKFHRHTDADGVWTCCFSEVYERKGHCAIWQRPTQQKTLQPAATSIAAGGVGEAERTLKKTVFVEGKEVICSLVRDFHPHNRFLPSLKWKGIRVIRVFVYEHDLSLALV